MAKITHHTAKPIEYYMSVAADMPIIMAIQESYGIYLSNVTKARKLRLVLFLLCHFDVVRSVIQINMRLFLKDPLFEMANKLSDRSKLQFCIALIEQILEAR